MLVQIEELYNYKQMTKTVSSKDKAGQPVVDAEGNIVTEEQAITISEDYQKLIAEVMAGNSGSGKVTNEGEDYMVSYASIPLKGESDTWSVITLYREKSAMAPVYRMIAVAAALALFMIAAAILVTALLARRLTKPIVSITELIQSALNARRSPQLLWQSQRSSLGLPISFLSFYLNSWKVRRFHSCCLHLPAP